MQAEAGSLEESAEFRHIFHAEFDLGFNRHRKSSLQLTAYSKQLTVNSYLRDKITVTPYSHTFPQKTWKWMGSLPVRASIRRQAGNPILQRRQ
jgi:hypothetical protein